MNNISGQEVFLVVLTPITKNYTHMLIEFLIKSKLVSLQNDSNVPTTNV